MTREEHVEWCKVRAREYLKNGDCLNAITSMLSDMMKHPDCGLNEAIPMLAILAAQNNDRRETSRFIEGFN